MYDLIIIGGGPAGITAGIYAIRKKLNTLLVSKDFVGQAGESSLIENWPGEKQISGAQLLLKMKNHLESLGAEIKQEEVKNIEKKDCFIVETSQGSRYQAKAVIVASGALPRTLGIKGEKEFIGRGVSYCAICDAPFFNQKIVAVIGGGNSGLETALDLTKYAKKIYILEFSSKIKADEVLQERIRKETKIEIILGAQAQEIRGDSFVKELVYIDRKTKKEKTLQIDGVFVQIGRIPASWFVKGELVDLTPRGEIKIDLNTNQTKTPGLFAAGDVTSILYKQIIIAAGEGAKAALSCYSYLKQE
ncbi:FAD-dependent oxidoreductase [bacterium]|nr:FAD-dependent oxidoreductase [bacterium]